MKNAIAVLLAFGASLAYAGDVTRLPSTLSQKVRQELGGGAYEKNSGLTQAPDVFSTRSVVKLVQVDKTAPERGEDTALASSGAARTIAIMGAARDADPTESGKSIFATLKQNMAYIETHVPPSGFDFVACIDKPELLGFTMSGESNIYVCRRVARESLDYLAQVILHESIHVSGVDDECDTTRIEVRGMLLGAGKLAVVNGYVSSCGIPTHL